MRTLYIMVALVFMMLAFISDDCYSEEEIWIEMDLPEELEFEVEES